MKGIPLLVSKTLIQNIGPLYKYKEPMTFWGSCPPCKMFAPLFPPLVRERWPRHWTQIEFLSFCMDFMILRMITLSMLISELPCASSPCINGTCRTQEGFGSYLCECIKGFAGLNCETGRYWLFQKTWKIWYNLSIKTRCFKRQCLFQEYKKYSVSNLKSLCLGSRNSN